jgi:hypothetical protein
MNTMLMWRGIAAQCSVASRAARRSSSAHTSAMRPEIVMRPTWAGACPASRIRTTRNGLHPIELAVILGTSGMYIGLSATEKIADVGLPEPVVVLVLGCVDGLLSLMGKSLRHRPCKGAKTPGIGNRAVFIENLSKPFSVKFDGRLHQHGVAD